MPSVNPGPASSQTTNTTANYYPTSPAATYWPTTAAPLICVAGDSIAQSGSVPVNTTVNSQSDSFTSYAVGYSFGRLKQGNNISQPGWTTPFVLANWGVIAAQQPKFVVLEFGFNDLSLTTNADIGGVNYAAEATAQGLRQTMLSLISQITAWGGYAILCTVVPVPTGYSSYTPGRRAVYMKYNNWVRDQARIPGVLVFDLANIVVDPSDTTNANPYSVGFQTNSPHPGGEMRRALGKKLWTDILSIYVGGSDPNTAAQYTSLGSNQFPTPMLTGTGGTLNSGTGTLPDNVYGFGETAGLSTTNATGATFSIVASTDKQSDASYAAVTGNWVQVSCNTAAIGTNHLGVEFRPASGIIASAPAGTTFRGRCEVNIITPGTQLVAVEARIQNCFSGNFTAGTVNASGSSAFSPYAAAGNAVLTAHNILLETPDCVLSDVYTNFCMRLYVYAAFWGSAASTTVFQVRRPEIWQVTPVGL